MNRQVLWLCILVLCGCGKPAPVSRPEKAHERIISLAPNITETLYDLGLEANLVGITRFSESSIPETGLPIVGDFMNVNYETLVSLRPDLVILERSADAQKARLESLGIDYLETCSLSIADIIQSIRDIAEVCEAEAEADRLLDGIKQQMEAARNNPSIRPRILITFGEFSTSSEVEQIYAFGASCIHSELLEIAGGDVAITDARPSVMLSREALIRLDPEIIIELTGGGPGNRWDNLVRIDAVKNNRVYVLDGSYTCIPSPKNLMQTLMDFSDIIRRHMDSR